MILSVLKIIGIILLVVLALMILILGTILFVPIHYRFDGRYVEHPEFHAQVKWNPVLLKIFADYKDDKFEYVIRMLGGVIMTNQEIPLSWLGRKISTFFDETPADEEDYENMDTIQDTMPQKDESLKKQEKKNSENEISDKDKKELNVVSEITKEEDATYKEQSDFKQKKSPSFFLRSIRDKINTIKRKIQNILKKVKMLNEKREQLLKVYHSKRFEVAKKDVFLYIKKLWNVIKPKKLEGYIHYGMNDPALTGQVLGGMSMFLIFYDEFLKIVPDFETACFDGFLRGKGKIRLFSVLKLLIEIRFNKNLIKVIKKVQTIIEA